MTLEPEKSRGKEIPEDWLSFEKTRKYLEQLFLSEFRFSLSDFEKILNSNESDHSCHCCSPKAFEVFDKHEFPLIQWSFVCQNGSILMLNHEQIVKQILWYRSDDG